MKRRVVALVLLVLAAACSPAPPPQVDWCYWFDFKTTNNFNIVNGTWQDGIGYVNDDNYNLSINYDAGIDVTPVQVTVSVERVDAGDITARANGIIFGISGDTGNQTLPADQVGSDVSFTNESADASGPGANISASASSRMAVTALFVYGRNANPFGVSNCEGYVPTPTPVPTGTLTPFPTIAPSPTDTPPPTFTLSVTPSPTITNTPTPGPSATPTIAGLTWYHIFNFEIGPNSANWSSWAWNSQYGGGYAPNGTWSTGIGWVEDVYPSGPTTFRVDNYLMTKSISAHINYVQVTYDVSFGSGGNGNMGLYRNGTTTNVATAAMSQGNNQVLTFNTNIDVSRLQIGIAAGSGTSGAIAGRYAHFRKIIVGGTGTDPFTQETPTPTATMTETLTSTPSDTPTLTTTPGPSATRTPIPTWTPPGGTPASLTPQPTPSRTSVPVYYPSWTPQPTINRTGTQQNRETRTATLATATANAHLTQTAVVVTGTANAYATGTATAGGTPTPGATGTIDYSLPPVPGEGELTPIMTGIPTPGDSGDLKKNTDELGGNVFSTLSNSILKAFGWLGNLNSLSTILTAWNSTAATPLPGLPQCKVAPLSSELCAIYYFLTYTLLSGAVGSLLIPMAVIVVDVWCILSFVRLVRAILARLGKIRQ